MTKSSDEGLLVSLYLSSLHLPPAGTVQTERSRVVDDLRLESRLCFVVRGYFSRASWVEEDSWFAGLSRGHLIPQVKTSERESSEMERGNPGRA